MISVFHENKRLWFRASAPFLLVLLLGIVSSVSILLIKDRNQWVHHTDAVIKQAFTISKLVIDMETAERGFLLVGKERFLEPYHRANEKIDNELLYLEGLVGDNPDQTARVQQIKQLIKQWKGKAAEPEINKRRDVNMGQIDIDNLQALLSKETGKKILDQIRGLLTDLDKNFREQKQTEGRRLALQVAKDMVDMETGERGFLITGSENFLEPYNSGHEALGDDINALLNYSQNKSPEALPYIQRLKLLSSQWLQKAATPEIKARREINQHQATVKGMIDMVESEIGKSIMDKLRVELASFTDEERRLRRARVQTANAVADGSLLYTLISAIVALLLGYRLLKRKG